METINDKESKVIILILDSYFGTTKLLLIIRINRSKKQILATIITA